MFNLIAMAGFVIVIVFPSWQAVIVGAVFFISWSAISLPATVGLIARVLPAAKRTMGVSMHSLVNRIPMALGPLLGGLCIAAWGERDGVRVAFGAALAFAVMAIFLQQKFIDGPDGDRPASPSGAPHAALRSLWRQMRPELKRLLISDILVRFCEQITHAFVVVWCMKAIAAPVSAVQFGVLTTIEMATAVLIYIPVAYLADRGRKKPFVLMTFILFTCFPLVLMLAESFEWLVLAFVVRGLKEFGEPTRKALIVDLSPEASKAGMFGLYYLLRDVVVAVAAFGGAFLWEISPQTNFIAAFCFGVLGTLWAGMTINLEAMFTDENRRGRTNWPAPYRAKFFAFFLNFFLPRIDRPNKPIPISTIVAGSGTGAVFRAVWPDPPFPLWLRSESNESSDPHQFGSSPHREDFGNSRDGLGQSHPSSGQYQTDENQI